MFELSYDQWTTHRSPDWKRSWNLNKLTKEFSGNPKWKRSKLKQNITIKSVQVVFWIEVFYFCCLFVCLFVCLFYLSLFLLSLLMYVYLNLFLKQSFCIWHWKTYSICWMKDCEINSLNMLYLECPQRFAFRVLHYL